MIEFVLIFLFVMLLPKALKERTTKLSERNRSIALVNQNGLAELKATLETVNADNARLQRQIDSMGKKVTSLTRERDKLLKS